MSTPNTNTNTWKAVGLLCTMAITAVVLIFSSSPAATTAAAIVLAMTGLQAVSLFGAKPPPSRLSTLLDAHQRSIEAHQRALETQHRIKREAAQNALDETAQHSHERGPSYSELGKHHAGELNRNRPKLIVV